MSEKFSFSKIDTYNQCPMKYKKKYEEKKFSSKSSLALELGTIAHKVKEEIGKTLIEGATPDYEACKTLLYKGCDETKGKRTYHIAGVDELREKYFFDWVKPDDKTGATYEDKIALFLEHLKDMENDEEWKPIACELPVDFLFMNKYHFQGSIDRVDQNKNGDIRIVDYKTSKKMFDESYVKTPLQMIIYDLSIQRKMNKVPVSHVYDFIFLGKQQEACSKGYQKRGEKKLQKLFNSIEESKASGLFVPKPTPLCHWCDYCSTNPNADDRLKHECPYYSLWTPTNKIFEVNKAFDTEKEVKSNEFWF